MDLEERMYLFVDGHPEGVREKDVKDVFEGRGLNKVSHGTFAKHWKNLKVSKRVVVALDADGNKRYYTCGHLEKNRRDVTVSPLLKQLEERLGSELDLGGLLLRVHSLNNLMNSGARVSSQQAEITKEEIESDIRFIKLSMNEDDPKFSEKETLLNALRDHLKLAVDSLVKQ